MRRMIFGGAIIIAVAAAIIFYSTGRTRLEPVAELSLPDPVQKDAIPGFTGTGLDRVTRGPYRLHWAVGDDGRVRKGDGSGFAPKVHLVSPDFSKIVATIQIEGDHSLQGVAVDTSGSEDTIWVATEARGDLLHYRLDGSEIAADRVRLVDLGLEPSANGLAYAPEDRSLLVGSAKGKKVYRLRRNGAGVMAVVARHTLTRVPDHFHYDAERGGLFYSTGENGDDGSVRFYDLRTGADRHVFGPLARAQAIEGIYVDDASGILHVVNDGGFHPQAEPARNMVLRYRVSQQRGWKS